MMLSPEVVIETLSLPSGPIEVVRDDLLPGGTKQRAILPFLTESHANGKTEFVYASPFSGFAQVALAASCQQLGLRCVLFCETDAARGDNVAHAFTALAASHGAEIHLFATLEAAENAAETFAAQASTTRLKIPLGFACTLYQKYLSEALTVQWRVIEQKLGRTPKRVWLPLGSGTLARVFRGVVAKEVALCCVDVHVLDDSDARVKHVCGLSAVSYHSAPETFAEVARLFPTVDSNAHYDAKLWQFLMAYAEPGDLWWNVAR